MKNPFNCILMYFTCDYFFTGKQQLWVSHEGDGLATSKPDFNSRRYPNDSQVAAVKESSKIVPMCQ